ncbi:MAG: hypothetical protein WCY11_19060 [Novosphingobium sp.]
MVVPIGLAQSDDAGVAPFVAQYQIVSGRPVDRRVIETFTQILIGHDARVTAIAVGE